ncbi:MAG TPA: SGNH/GDSL hydrolase family protein [Candidatus Dormibacteraeota bacterium]|nr:SGNH/GDSL hydrolase family protein [Candidatus Dormibacteraeota bacterium]
MKRSARPLVLLGAMVLLVAAAAPASAESEGHSYLALGDSIPFGFNPALWSDASNFVGFPEIVAQRLNVEDVNASCPGEATGSFISLTGTDNGCRDYRFALNEPLHVDYAGAQLAFAVAYLASHKRTRLVTLMLGANDLGRWLTDCGQVPPGPTCALGFDGMLAVMRSNLDLIFTKLRATGYTGLIVAVNYPALNYKDPFFVDLALALDSQIEAAAANHGVLIASEFEAAAQASASANGDICAAGLQLPAFPPGTPGCDIHPSAKGRDLLAETVMNSVASSCPARDPIGCLDRSAP